MTKEEQLQLMIQSELDSFDNNYYPEALNAYFSGIHEALPASNIILL